MGAPDSIIEQPDFSELLLKAYVALKIGRQIVFKRILEIEKNPIFDSETGQVSKAITDTAVIGSLQLDPINNGEEALLYLAQRGQNADKTLDRDDALVDKHLKVLVHEIEQLRQYFGSKSGYTVVDQMTAKEKIDDFLGLAKRLGLSGETATLSSQLGGR